MSKPVSPLARLQFRHLPAVVLSVLWMVPIAACIANLKAQSAANVLLVVNHRDPVSQAVGDYYVKRRSVPARHVCLLETTSEETIDWQTYVTQIETPVGGCLKREHLEEKVLYIVTTMGVPLRIDGMGGSIQKSEQSSVDSELTLLYAKLHGNRFDRAGAVPNPFFGRRDSPGFPAPAVSGLPCDAPGRERFGGRESHDRPLVIRPEPRRVRRRHQFAGERRRATTGFERQPCCCLPAGLCWTTRPKFSISSVT